MKPSKHGPSAKWTFLSSSYAHTTAYTLPPLQWHNQWIWQNSASFPPCWELIFAANINPDLNYRIWMCPYLCLVSESVCSLKIDDTDWCDQKKMDNVHKQMVFYQVSSSCYLTCLDEHWLLQCSPIVYSPTDAQFQPSICAIGRDWLLHQPRKGIAETVAVLVWVGTGTAWVWGWGGQVAGAARGTGFWGFIIYVCEIQC